MKNLQAKWPKAMTAVCLALLLTSSGCAYFRPEPLRLGGQVTQENDAVPDERTTESPHAGWAVGFLEDTAYNVFKGFQAMGR
jgi:hypothetical protein